MSVCDIIVSEAENKYILIFLGDLSQKVYSTHLHHIQ